MDVEALYGRLREAVQANPELVVDLRADGDTRCEILARIMANARRAGAARLAFVSQPEVS